MLDFHRSTPEVRILTRPGRCRMCQLEGGSVSRWVERTSDEDSWYRNDRTLGGFEGRFVANEIEPPDRVKWNITLSKKIAEGGRRSLSVAITDEFYTFDLNREIHVKRPVRGCFLHTWLEEPFHENVYKLEMQRPFWRIEPADRVKWKITLSKKIAEGGRRSLCLSQMSFTRSIWTEKYM